MPFPFAGAAPTLEPPGELAQAQFYAGDRSSRNVRLFGVAQRRQPLTPPKVKPAVM
jgi:hypothetical protein